MFDHLRGSFRSRRSACRSATRIVRAVSVFVLALSTAPLMGCQNNAPFDPASAGTFFPLHRGSRWTYRIIDKNLATNQIVTDRALGAGHIDTLKAAGDAVSESANMNA